MNSYPAPSSDVANDRVAGDRVAALSYPQQDVVVQALDPDGVFWDLFRSFILEFDGSGCFEFFIIE